MEPKCKLGKGLHLSRVVIGDGLLGNGSMVNRTALVSERFSMLIDAKQLTDEGAVAAIIATLDNSSFTEGFSYRELGLMGVDPDTSQEGLYLYDNAGEECEFLDTRANGAIIYERLKLLIKMQETGNISLPPSARMSSGSTAAPTHIWNLLSDSVTTEPQPRDELIIFLSEFLSERKSFVGTATELAEALEKRSEETLVPAALTKRLIRCRDELAARGIKFETHRTRDRRELRLALVGDGSDGNDGKPDTGSVPNLLSQPSHLSRDDA